MLGGGKRQPDARPNAAAALHLAPTLTGYGRLEESPPLPIDCLGEDPLLAAEPRRLCNNRGPVDGIVRGTSRKLAPALLGVLHPRQCWGGWGGGAQQWRSWDEALNRRQGLRPRPKERGRRNFRQGAKPHAAPTKGQTHLQIHRSREPGDGSPDCCSPFAHHGVKLGGQV